MGNKQRQGWLVRVVGDGVWSWQGNSAADGGGEEVGSDGITLNLFTNISCEGVSEHAT